MKSDKESGQNAEFHHGVLWEEKAIAELQPHKSILQSGAGVSIIQPNITELQPFKPLLQADVSILQPYFTELQPYKSLLQSDVAIIQPDKSFELRKQSEVQSIWV